MIATVEAGEILSGSLSESAALSGSIALESALQGAIGSELVLGGSVSMPETFDRFSGEYRVVPAVESKVLQTKDKLMGDDVTVESIPYYEVSNPAGGATIVIGDSIG